VGFLTCYVSAKLEGFDGWNVDFEPTVRGTTADAVAYAGFLTKFADAMHAAGLRLSVDISLWNPLWCAARAWVVGARRDLTCGRNMPLLANTSLDRVVTMQTYTGAPPPPPPPPPRLQGDTLTAGRRQLYDV
jgi:hypothetical protein